MNLENIAKLREWLADGAKHKTVHFNMAVGLIPEIDNIEEYEYADSDTLPETCGSACCLAGAAVSIMAPEKWLATLIEARPPNVEADWAEIFQKAQDLLGLNREQAEALFEPVLHISRSELTVADAIQALDNLVADPDDDPWRHIDEDL